MANVYKVSASFEVQDKLTAKLDIMIGRLEKAAEWADKCNKAMILLGGGLEYAALEAKGLNTQLTSMGLKLGKVDREGTRVGTIMTRMAQQTGRATSGFVRMNLELDKISIGAQNAGNSLNKMSSAGAAASRSRMTSAATAGAMTGAAMAGRAMGGGGLMNKGLMAMIGFDIAKAGMHPAMEYEQEMRGLGAFGLDEKQMKRAQQAARRTSRDVPASNDSENLKSIRRGMSITQHFDTALEVLPDLARAKVAMDSISERIPSLKGKGKDMQEAMLRGAEMLGDRDPKQIRQYIDGVVREYAASGASVDPKTIALNIRAMRSARNGKSDDFLFGIGGYFSQENKGGSAGGGQFGVMASTLDNNLRGSTMNKLTMQDFASMGLFEGQTPGDGSHAKPSMFGGSTMTNSTTQKRRIKNELGFIQDQAQWAWHTWEPAMLKKNFPGLNEKDALAKFQGMTQGTPDEKAKAQQMIMEGGARGLPKTARDLFTQYITMRPALEQHIELYHRAESALKQYNEATKMTAVKAESAGQMLYGFGLHLGRLATPAIQTGLDAIVGLGTALNGIMDKMPGTTEAFDQLNQAVFGTSGAASSAIGLFKQLGDSMSWMLDPLDKYLTMMFHGMSGLATGIGDLVNLAAHPSEDNAKKFFEHQGKAEQQSWKDVDAYRESMGGLWKDNSGKKSYGSILDEIQDKSGHVNIKPSPGGSSAGGGSGAFDAGQIVINFNGAVGDPAKAAHMVGGAVVDALLQAARLYQATTGSAGGVHNNPALAGGNP